MVTIAEQWEQQAMEKGIAKGIEIGIEKAFEKSVEKGEALLLTNLLTWRFGSLPAWVETELADAAPQRVETWARRLLDARTLEAVFGERNAP